MHDIFLGSLIKLQPCKFNCLSLSLSLSLNICSLNPKDRLYQIMPKYWNIYNFLVINLCGNGQFQIFMGNMELCAKFMQFFIPLENIRKPGVSWCFRGYRKPWIIFAKFHLVHRSLQRVPIFQQRFLIRKL